MTYSVAMQPTAQEAWERTLSDLLESGTPFAAEKPGIEILAYTIRLQNMRARMGGHPLRPLSVVSAVARFVWMMAGSDRLEDIAFYEPKVRPYTDDDLAVPGSSYGARLRRAGPGLDQIEEAIKRLQPDPRRLDGHLRRAANVIWRPEDAARSSNDIPCAFGLSYFPRDGVLHTELVMRSNNAMTLLPFNLFEFTLLAEVIAVAAKLEPGPFTLHAMSMHLFDVTPGRDDATRIGGQPAAGVPDPMPPVPTDDPLGQINLLCQIESKLRHEQEHISRDSATILRARAGRLDDFWRAFFDVLLVHALTKVNRPDIAGEVIEYLPAWAAAGAITHVEKSSGTGEPAEPLVTGQLFELADDGRNVQDRVRAALVGAGDEQPRAHIDSLLDRIETGRGTRFTHSEATLIAHRLLHDEVRIAARSDGGSGHAEDYLKITEADVRTAIADLGL
jgi:hypothetical protein